MNMKNIKRFILLASVAAVAAGCADWLAPETVKIGHTDLTVTDKDNAYYQALREYKASDHEISFGWYSRWDEPALTTDGMLTGIPDSMDVVSLWSNSRNLSPKRMEDLRFVQKVKGTKVLICTFCQYVGKGFTPAEYDGSEEEREAFWGWVDGDDNAIAASIAKYAKAISDTVAFYGYDGLDIDFEPYIDGVKGKLDENREYARILFTELSKYFGPKSGTGLLFVVDGEIYNLSAELAGCFDYFVSQAYTVSGGTPSPTATGSEANMDTRLQQMVNLFAGELSEEEVTRRFVVTENLESAVDGLNGGFFWRTRDGVTQDKNKIPSMLGMAMWQPANGFRKGGFGGYRFDNEAVNDPSYKWMRKGIQAQNPAGGLTELEVRFFSGAEVSYSVELDDNGVVSQAAVEDVFKLSFVGRTTKDDKFTLAYDPSLVDGYNENNGTKYLSLDASRVTLSGIDIKADAASSGDASVSVDVTGLQRGYYLVPVRITYPEDSYWRSEGELVRYIKVNVLYDYVTPGASSLTGVKLQPTDAWRANFYNGLNLSGWTGCWNNDTEDQQKALFDGKRSVVAYTYTSYFNPGNIVIDMGEENEVSGLRWHSYYGSTYDRFTVGELQASDDRANWDILSSNTFSPVMDSDNWVYIQLKKPVRARYVRMVLYVSYYLSINEIEVYGPEN